MDVADAIHQARELQIRERSDEALRLLLAAADEHDDEDLWFEIAGFYLDRGMTRQGDLALADFDEADKWADLPGTKAGRAAILARRGELEKAEALVAEALEVDPELALAHGTTGELRFRQGRYREAVEALAKALELRPDLGAAWAMLVRALEADGKKDFARKALSEAAKKCPRDSEVLVALAESYVAQDDLARARRALEESVVVRPENGAAWRLLAWVSAKDGDLDTMRHALENAVVIDRDATMEWIAKESLTVPELNAFGK